MNSTNRSAKTESLRPPPFGLKENLWQNVFAAAAGILLGLALLKFGNPVIFDQLIARPSGILELVFQPWPIAWGYTLLGGLALLSLKAIRFTLPSPSWIPFLPLVWLSWQIIAALKTIDPNLTRTVLFHFSSCVLWFYLGVFALSRLERSILFWFCLGPAFVLMLWLGFEQHYGGLEATRRFFYEQPNWREYPPDYLKRMASDRIFSTLVYPNAFAGAILLYLPVMLSATWQFGQRLPGVVRRVVTGLVGYLGLACLFWSGSKASWLIALLMTIVVLGWLPLSRRLRTILAVAIVAFGLAGFAAKFSSYFQKGATSVAARFYYWSAAINTARENPVLGTGPGTFSVVYAKVKPPQAEMARLTHNDYLQQASDSGAVGLASYLAFVVGSILFLYRKRSSDLAAFAFTAWLGLLGWSMHAFVEFPLYIPALAWPAFTFLGWLWGSAKSE